MADHLQNPIQVQPPGVRPRSRGLLTDVAIDLNTLQPTEGSNYNPATAVLGGVVFCSDACNSLSAVENRWCEEVLLPEDYYEASLSGPFDTFWVQADDLSPTMGYDSALTRARLEARYRARISAAIATELLTGAVTGGPSLSSEAISFTPAAVPVDEALFIMEEALALLGGVQFVLHSSPGLFELLIAAYDITQDDRETADDPNRLPFRLPTGHILVGDAGHHGSVAPEGEGPGGSWLYATTDIIYWTDGPHYIGDETGNFDRSANTRSSVYGANVLVAFDQCAVIAVNVDVPEFFPAASGD